MYEGHFGAVGNMLRDHGNRETLPSGGRTLWRGVGGAVHNGSVLRHSAEIQGIAHCRPSDSMYFELGC